MEGDSSKLNKYRKSNLIDETMIAHKVLHFIRVIIFLFNASYVLGMLWIILMECIEHEYLEMEFKDLKTEEQLIE